MKAEITEKERKAIIEACKIYVDKNSHGGHFRDLECGFNAGAEFALSELRKPSESETGRMDEELVQKIVDTLERNSTASECPECDTLVPFKSVQVGDFRDVATEIAKLAAEFDA